MRCATGDVINRDHNKNSATGIAGTAAGGSLAGSLLGALGMRVERWGIASAERRGRIARRVRATAAHWRKLESLTLSRPVLVPSPLLAVELSGRA